MATNKKIFMGLTSQNQRVAVGRSADTYFVYDGITPQRLTYLQVLERFDFNNWNKRVIMYMVDSRDRSDFEEFPSYIGDISDNSPFVLDNISDDEIEKRVIGYYNYEKVNKNRDIFDFYKFKRHLLFIGHKGEGKTYSVYEALDRLGLEHIFIGGQADMDAVDLKGMLVPYVNTEGQREFIWIDGPLTQAFRRASKGEKIVLFVDELLRISPNGQSSFISSFTPNNKREFVLNTGRIINVEDGIGTMEILKAPMENLWLIGTTNIGAEYDIGHVDAALFDRLELIEIESDIKKMEYVLRCTAQSKGEEFFPLVDKIMDFYKSMLDLNKNFDISKPNLRHLTNALEECQSPDDLGYVLTNKITKWATRDIEGKLIENNVTAIEKIIQKHAG